MSKEKFSMGNQNDYQKALIENAKNYIEQSEKDGYIYAGGSKYTSFYKKGKEGFVVNKKTGEIKVLPPNTGGKYI